MNYRMLIVICVVSFLLMVSIHLLSDYFGKKEPFTKGLYRKGLSSRIDSLSLYKNRVTVKLINSDSVYSFLPDPDVIRVTIDFWDIVQEGDSLWKKPMSDTIYTLGKNGIMYVWPFWTHDKFGRSYLDEEMKESR